MIKAGISAKQARNLEKQGARVVEWKADGTVDVDVPAELAKVQEQGEKVKIATKAGKSSE